MRRLCCIAFICLLLVGCTEKDSIDANKEGYQTISAAEAKAMMNGDVVILDVRTEVEYEEEHIEGAMNVPLNEIDQNIINQLESKDKTILVYCASGNRSKQAAAKLSSLGYTHVYNFGGISDWTYGVVSED